MNYFNSDFSLIPDYFEVCATLSTSAKKPSFTFAASSADQDIDIVNREGRKREALH
jgi:hypothetical protein